MTTNTKISAIKARQILDSRGNPTVEVDVILESGICGRAAVPSGASTGEREALELRDNDKKRYIGKGVLNAIENIKNIIAPKIIGLDSTQQLKIDKLLIELDGTENKSNLGANAILGVSLAVARAAATALGLPLYKYIGGTNSYTIPVPCLNIINGGAHADNNIDIQEFMIVPAGLKSFSDAIRCAVEIYHNLKNILKKNKLSTGVGDEGGFAPNLSSNEDGIKIIIESINQAGYKPKEDVFIALDVAASELYKEGKYIFEGEKKEFNKIEIIDYYEKLVSKYPICSIEDGMAEGDWEGWKLLTEKLGNKIQLVGDDIFVTNPKILSEGIKNKIANAILIKLNQIGTLTETLQTMNLAFNNSYKCMVSHRSGETPDDFIADLAVATNCGLIKTGAPARGERVSKYNRLLRIEEELGDIASFHKIF